MNSPIKAFVLILNEDNTEGRGPLYLGQVCELRETAERLAKGRGVQGSDADVRECQITKQGGYWHGPVELMRPSDADIEMHRKRHAARILEEKRALIFKKATELGLTEEEISLLKTP